MTMPAPMRPAQLAAESSGALHRDLFRWLHSVWDHLSGHTHQHSALTGLQVGLHVARGAVVGYWLSAADLADATKFSATGLGVGDYAGWAVCNGSNGTPNLDGLYPYWSTAEAGTPVGTNDSSHEHEIDHDHGSFTSGAGSSHSHGPGSLATRLASSDGADIIIDSVSLASWTYDNKFTATAGAWSSASGSNSYGVAVDGQTADESIHTHTADPPPFSGTSGAASATDNRPASKSLVPLMRL